MKKIGINALLNFCKTSLQILFPLLTYPYISRILGVENIGKINYTASIVSYFSLVAALGISTYAIREGGRIREDSVKLQRLANELFTINILSALLSYLLIFILLFFVNNNEYRILIGIQSLSILFNTIGVDWINVLFEDFFFITIRSLILQVISVFSIFYLVKSVEDLYLYVGITVLVSALTSLVNLIYCRRYLKLSFTKVLNFNKHFRPLMTLFFSGLAISIYATSDTVILEWLRGPYYVGLYAMAAKVYTIIKNLLASIYSVSIPKLSSLFGTKSIDDFKNTYSSLLGWITLILIPMSSGVIILSKEIILFMGGSDFAESIITLRLLAVSLIGAIFGGILTYGFNIPVGREKVNFIGALYGILVNVILSFLLIPFLAHNGAAISTISSEFFIFFYNLYKLKEDSRLIDLIKWKLNIYHSLIGFFSILIIGYIVNLLILPTIIKLSLVVTLSVILYGIELIYLKNELFLVFLNNARKKISNYR